jgi:hypothetical protein
MLRSCQPERQKADAPPSRGAEPEGPSARRSSLRGAADSPRLPAADRFTPRAPQAPMPLADQVSRQARRRADGDFEAGTGSERSDDSSAAPRAGNADTTPIPVEARHLDKPGAPAASATSTLAQSPRLISTTQPVASAKASKKGGTDKADARGRDKAEEAGGEERESGASGGKKQDAGAKSTQTKRGAQRNAGKGKAKKAAGAKDGGKGERAGGKAGGGGAALPPMMMPALPPLPFPPRLGGISARGIPSRPPLSEEQAKDILQRTGMRPEEHHDKVRVSLDGVARKALRLQAQIVREAENSAFDASFRLTARGLAAADSLGLAEKRVVNAYANARGGVQGTAASALKTLAGRRTEAEEKFTDKTLTMEQQVERVLRTSSPAVQALHKKQLAEATSVLEQTAKEYKEKLLPHARKVLTSTPEAITEGSDAIALARIETEKEAWSKGAKEKAFAMQGNIEANAAAVIAQKEAYSVEILGLVNPAAVQLEEVATGEKDELGKARTVTRRRVATDYERAVNAITIGRDAAMSSLSQGEAGALRELAATRARLKLDIDARKKNLEASIIGTAGAMAEAYRSQMAGLNQSIDPTQFLELRRMTGLMAAADKRLQRSFDQQQLDLRQTVKSTLAGAEESIEAELGRARALADNCAEEARRIAGEQISGIVGARDGLIQALEAPMKAVDGKASPYRAQSTEKLGQRPKQVEASVKAMLAGTKAALGEMRDKEDQRLQKLASNLKSSLAAGIIAQSNTMISDLIDRGKRAHAAMDQLGTNEGDLFNALRGITQLQGGALKQIWSAKIDKKTSLPSWLESELSGGEEDTAFAYLSGDVKKGARLQLEASLHWYGDDTKEIEEVLRDLDKSGMLKDVQNEEAWKGTLTKVKGSLKGTDLKVTEALLSGNRFRADALRLRDKIEEARRSGSNEKLNQALEGIPPGELAQVRKEFGVIQLAKEKGISEAAASKIEQSPAEAKASFEKFITADRQVDVPAGRHGETRTRTMKLEGSDKKLALALAQREADEKGKETVDSQVAVRAARMEVATEQRGGKLEGLQKAFEFDEGPELDERRNSHDPEARRQAEVDRAEAHRIRDLAFVRFAKEKGGLKDPSVEDAKNYASTAVSALYGNDKDGAQSAEFARSMIKEGFGDPALAMVIATRDTGTNKDLITKTLGRLDKDGIARLRADYAERFGNKDPDALDKLLGTNGKGGVMTELSGDDRLEVDLLMLGRPKNDRDRFELEKARTKQQRDEAGIMGGNRTMFGDRIDLRDEHERDMLKMVSDAEIEAKKQGRSAFDEHGRFLGKDPIYNEETKKYEPNPQQAWEFQEQLKWNKFGVESYQRGVDNMANLLATVLAVVVAVVITVATGGVGGAVAGAIIGGVLSMGVKRAIKGGRYGWEEMAVDLAVTAVDAATAGLTAGLGQAMRGAATAAKVAGTGAQAGKATIGPLAKKAAGSLSKLGNRGTAGKAAAWVLSEGAENLAGSVPSALTQNLLDEKNWKQGNPFTNILKGTALQAGISTGAGLGMGLGMEIGGSVLGSVRGALRDRAMQKELLRSIPIELRPRFADVPIVELPAQKFKEMTGSESARAMTMMRPEGPTVYVKQGTDPKLLREEGLHLLQSHEAGWAPKVKDLSEANLARWGEMGVGERLGLYKNKLELEIDAQKRLLDDLGAEIIFAGPLGRRSLKKQIVEIELSLTNLERRLGEVDAIGPDQLRRMTNGVEPPPQYLDEPARLFNKKAKPAEPGASVERGASGAERGAPGEGSVEGGGAREAGAAPDRVPDSGLRPRAGDPGQRLIVEPFTGPSLESPIAIARENPDARVMATERTTQPEADQQLRAKEAGVEYHADNKPAAIEAAGGADQMFMRFPLPHERAVEQDAVALIMALEAAHPDLPRGELLERAMREAHDSVESVLGYSPFALRALKPDGEMHVVFWEPEIKGDLDQAAKLRYVDPVTGQGYRLEIESVSVRPLGEVAPHSGFGIPGRSPELPVHVAALRKVPASDVTPQLPQKLEPRTRRAMEIELVNAGQARESLRSLSDAEFAGVYRKAQVDLLPKRLDEFRLGLPDRAHAEFDRLRSSPDQHKPIDLGTAERLSTALDTSVRIDASLPPGEVRVHYDIGLFGNVRGFEIRAGRGATVADVLLHAPTLGALKRYEGMAGVFYRMYDAVERFMRGGGRLPLGSVAHESWLEMQKLPALIQARRQRLMSGALDLETRLKLSQELENLEDQLARHMDSLEDFVPGLGFIAGAPKGKGTIEAANRRYPEAEKPGYLWRLDTQGETPRLVYSQTHANSGPGKRRAYDAVNGQYVAIPDNTTPTTIDAILKGFPVPPDGHHYHYDPVTGYEVRLNPNEIGKGTLPKELYRTDAGEWAFRPRTEADLPVIRNHPYREDVEIKETLPKDLAATPDLRAEFERLLKARDAALKAREDAKLLLPSKPDPADKAATQAWRERPEVDQFYKAANDVAIKSRDLGTFAADVHVKNQWPEAKLIYPTKAGSRSGDFDLVYEIGPNQYVVVEAKGGAGQLTTRKVSPDYRAIQGTQEYYNSIVNNMEEIGGEAEEAALKLLAAGHENVTYLHVALPLSSPETPSGALKTVVDGLEVNAFDIRQLGKKPEPSPTGTDP